MELTFKGSESLPLYCMDPKYLSEYEFAMHVKKRHGMYFTGAPKFSDLYYLITGYATNARSSDNPPMAYFNVWVKKKYNKWGASMHWGKALLEECNNNEEKAFWKYFDLLEEFHKIKPLKIYSANLADEDFKKYYNTNNNKTWAIVGASNRRVIEPAPYHIKVIEFDYGTHAYHYDYFYVVSETDTGRHQQSFSNLEKCFEYYQTCFGKLNWEELPGKEVESSFASIAKNCLHGNSISHYIDESNGGIHLK